jgi:hypothetical protein
MKAEVAAQRSRPKDVRDAALMLVGRDLMARTSELVSITLESITWKDNGTALVALHRRKTDDLHTSLLGYDAVAALQRWLRPLASGQGLCSSGLPRAARRRAAL